MHATPLLRFLFCCIAIQLGTMVKAQEPLPSFEVRDIGSGRIVISWFNKYPKTAQITIQRSFDSLRGYKSILTVPDPTAVQNGFADTKADNNHMFYRLYILLDKGDYFFTTPKRPIKQAAVAVSNAPYTTASTSSEVAIAKNQVSASSAQRDRSAQTQANATAISLAAPALSEDPKEDSATRSLTRQQFTVKKVEPVVIKLDPSKMGDSAKVPFTVSPQNDPDAYAPSLYVYAQADGNIRIDVPNKKRLTSYRIRFYEPDKQLLFELRQLPAPSFQLDKTNFLHSGWFHFELYEESRLIERHKVFLEKDF